MIIDDYERIGWSASTPLSTDNLNHMDKALKYDRDMLKELNVLLINLGVEALMSAIESTQQSAEIAQTAASTAQDVYDNASAALSQSEEVLAKADEIAGFDVTNYLQKEEATELYGSKNDVESLKTSVNQNASSIRLLEVNTSARFNGVVAFRNADPTEAFSAQTVEYFASGVPVEYEVFYRPIPTLENLATTGRIPIDRGVYLQALNTHVYWRTVDISYEKRLDEETGGYNDVYSFDFSACTRRTIASSPASTSQNTFLVPEVIKIYYG